MHAGNVGSDGGRVHRRNGLRFGMDFDLGDTRAMWRNGNSGFGTAMIRPDGQTASASVADWAGLVERRAVENDRRSNALSLTAAGAALLRQAKRLVTSHERRLAGGLDPAERRRLVTLLGRIFPERR